MSFSFVRATFACAILEGISGLEPPSETTAPRYLKKMVGKFSGTDSIQSKTSSERHLVGKRTTQNKHQRQPSEQPFPILVVTGLPNTEYLFLCLTRITNNNHIPRLKPPKNQNRRAALGRPAIKLLGGGGGGGGLQLVYGRPTLALTSALVP